MVKLQKTTQMQAECVEKNAHSAATSASFAAKTTADCASINKTECNSLQTRPQKTSQNLRHFPRYFVAKPNFLYFCRRICDDN